MFDFGHDVVLVTGAGSGIGLAIARAFYDHGARVALCDFRADALEAVKSRFSDATRITTVPADVRDATSISLGVERVESGFGPISVVAACAGIYPNTPVLDLSVAEWDRVMETNVRGVFLTCQATARRMIASGIPGKIITISSTAAQIGRPGAAHYCASKAAVVMLTKVLALELARYRINVNTIAPGLVEVEGGISPLSREYVDAMIKVIPWDRVGQPGDIANAALFLASSYAEFITGEVLLVDGGASAGRTNLPLSSPIT